MDSDDVLKMSFNLRQDSEDLLQMSSKVRRDSEDVPQTSGILSGADLPSVHLLVFVCVVQHAHEKFLRN